MSLGILIGKCTVLPAQTPGGIDRHIIHSRPRLCHEVPFRHKSGVFIQFRCFIEREIIIRRHAPGQPALMLIIWFFSKSDPVKHIAGCFSFRRLHIIPHNLPIQGSHHVTKNIRSFHLLLHPFHLCFVSAKYREPAVVPKV